MSDIRQVSEQGIEYSKVRAVLFDYGGVLADEGFQLGLTVIAQSNDIDPAAFLQAATEAVYTTGFVTGTGDEDMFWEALRKQFNIAGSNEMLGNQILDRFVLRPGILTVVSQLRKSGLLCGILSDQTDWLERLDERDRFFAAFDRVYNSYRVGKTKRDASLFQDVAGELSLAPEQILFLDDSMGHVERAHSQGLQAGCCNSTESCLLRLQRLLEPV